MSDIRGYAELPDTQVLSGSETGSLLMWEGNFIKTEVFRTGKKRCHAGDITVCVVDWVTELNARSLGLSRRTHTLTHTLTHSLTHSLTHAHTHGLAPLQFVALERLPTGGDDRKGKMYFVTAGADGYMRWWDYETIDDAEVEEGAHFETEPLVELLVGDGVKISSMLRGDDHWIALDANGAIWKVSQRATFFVCYGLKCIHGDM